MFPKVRCWEKRYKGGWPYWGVLYRWGFKRSAYYTFRLKPHSEKLKFEVKQDN